MLVVWLFVSLGLGSLLVWKFNGFGQVLVLFLCAIFCFGAWTRTSID